MKKYLTWWLGIVLLMAVLIKILVPDPAERENTLGGLAIFAVISLIIIFKKLNDRWSGTITDIKTEHKYQSDDDGNGETYDVDYAYIKLSNGQTKKIKSKKEWQVGDRLEKRQGESSPVKL